MRQGVRVTFEPNGVSVLVQAGTSVLDAARRAGVSISAPCGGRGTCGLCAVEVLDGELGPRDEAERRALARSRAGIRLACRATVLTPVVLRPLVSAHHATQAVGGREDAGPDALAAAIDLGTTSVVCTIVDARSGAQVGFAQVPNAQSGWGADVLSRLTAAASGAADQLREAAIASVDEALGAASEELGGHIAHVVVAGNTAMASLLAGVDTSSLAAHPFTPPALPRQLDARPFDSLAADTKVTLLPPLAGFVGGDVLAGAVHAGLLDGVAEACALVDLGTNAEIALSVSGRLYVASAAAGPAFEAVGIECGGPAVPGAVTAVCFTGEGGIELTTIADQAPLWLSGSGLVSAIAELARCGHIRADGMLVEEGPLAERFSRDERGVLRVTLGETAAGRLVVSQLDVRAFQLAKAAVRVGFDAVLAAASVDVEGLSDVFIAGAFGGALNERDVVTLGLLPRRVEGRITWLGNSSLAGAIETALDEVLLEKTVACADSVVHVELAGSEGFNRQLVDALALEPR